MLKRNKLRGCSLRASRNQSKPLDNVAVTLTEQHFDRASECRAEIFPVASHTSIGTWRTLAREAATRQSSRCDFGSRAAVRCTLICPRYLLRVMSPGDQRSVYICDNTLIGWRVDSAVPHTTWKKDKKNKDCELSGLIFAHCRVGKLTAHRLQIDTTFCEWPPRSVICWHPRTGVSLPVTPSVIDGRSPSHLFLTCHSGHLFLPQPTCASAREQQHACCCSVTEHELTVEFRPLTLAGCTLRFVCQGFTFLTQSLQPGALTLAPRAKWVLAWVSVALLAAPAVVSISWWFEENWISPSVCHPWIFLRQNICDGSQIALTNTLSALQPFSPSEILTLAIQHLFPLLFYFFPLRWHHLHSKLTGIKNSYLNAQGQCSYYRS